VDWQRVQSGLEALESKTAETERAAVMAALRTLVPEMQADATSLKESADDRGAEAAQERSRESA